MANNAALNLTFVAEKKKKSLNWLPKCTKSNANQAKRSLNQR